MDRATLFGMVPINLRQDLENYLDYADDALQRAAKRSRKERHLKEIREDIEVVFVLNFLYSQYVIGLENYLAIANELDRMGISGLDFDTNRDNFLRFGEQDTEKVSREWRIIVQQINQIVDKTNSRQFMAQKPETIIQYFLSTLK